MYNTHFFHWQSQSLLTQVGTTAQPVISANHCRTIHGFGSAVVARTAAGRGARTSQSPSGCGCKWTHKLPTSTHHCCVAAFNIFITAGRRVCVHKPFPRGPRIRFRRSAQCIQRFHLRRKWHIVAQNVSFYYRCRQIMPPRRGEGDQLCLSVCLSVRTTVTCHGYSRHLSKKNCALITARRYPKRGICRRRVSVCPSVRVWVCVCVCVRHTPVLHQNG